MTELVSVAARHRMRVATAPTHRRERASESGTKLATAHEVHEEVDHAVNICVYI